MQKHWKKLHPEIGVNIDIDLSMSCIQWAQTHAALSHLNTTTTQSTLIQNWGVGDGGYQMDKPSNREQTYGREGERERAGVESNQLSLL